MYKLLIFVLYCSTLSVYAADANYNKDTGILDIPAVQIFSEGKLLGVYRAEMQRREENLLGSVAFKVEKLQRIDTGSFFLKRVRDNGRLLCGGRTDLPGFAYICPNGRNCGFDIALCQAVSAAVLNSPKGSITFVPVTTSDREKVLREKTIDILSRNSSWTSSRDIIWGHFTWIMYYDGQGFMVKADSGIKILTDLDDKRICVEKDTTSYTNLVDEFTLLGLNFTEVLASGSAIMTRYLNGECDAMTTDKSGLAARRASLDDSENHIILDITISKEPLTPVVPSGDEQWLDIVKIVLFGLVNAEELGITQANVDSMVSSSNRKIKRLLGVEGSFGQEQVGLETDAIANTIRAVGNYGEIYERYLGKNGINIARGPNKLARDGGQIYVPPMR
jgi:general L-amino acid transport system substrate-binding protein